MSETPHILPRPVNGSVGASSSWSVSLTDPALEIPSLPVAKLTRKIAILGFSETAKDAPVNDPSWELWGMNGFWRVAKKDFGLDVTEEHFSLWFDMHSVNYTRAYGERAGIGDSQYEWLKKEHPFPILSLEESEEFPSVQRYPIEDVIKANGRDYFTSTVAYALALAMSQDNVSEIGVWGIDLVHDSEYSDQRPCAEFYLGIAHARGIKLTIHDKSALLKQRGRYGYDAENPLFLDLVKGLETQIATLEKKMAELNAQNDRIVTEMQTNDGALQHARAMLGRLGLWQRGGRI